MTGNALDVHEELRRKGYLDVMTELESIQSQPTASVDQMILDVRATALKIGTYDIDTCSPARLRKTYKAQLKRMAKRFEMMTNEKEGKQHFKDDLQQNLLWWQGIKEAWPLRTVRWEPQTYKPGKSEQTLYKY